MQPLIDGEPGGVVDVLDRGLAYGDGVFRTLRVAAGTIRSWARHYRKLASDCRALGMACPTASVLYADASRVIDGSADLVLKIIVTRGSGGRGYSSAGSEGRRIVMGFPLPSHAGVSFDKGVAVRWCRTPAGLHPALSGIKHLNRLENVLARSEWDDLAISEGLMTDVSGRVISGTMSNLFLVEGGRLVTPDLCASGVAGVQRERLIDAAHREGIVCSIEHVLPERVRAADALLLANSVIGLWRVASLGDRRWQYDPRLERFRLWLDRDDD
jgi:4-amino-4-deoxychorismate lyase